ncbi:unnamed protein product [Auanema sp. JU1783]|nr:unnamed protein product [Auanema sp. JU1783]
MSQPFRDSTNKTPVSKLMKNMGDLSLRTFGGSSNVSMIQAKKGLRRRDVTPTRNASYINTSVMGDRFIGIRRTEPEQELANHLLQQAPDTSFNTSYSLPNSPVKQTGKDQLKKLMRSKSASNLESNEEERILVYKKNAAPLPAVGHLSQAKVLYSASCVRPSSSVKKSTRYIPQVPERILDAPDFRDDYYLNLIDWSSNSIVAVILGFSLYLWNADNGEIQLLFELDGNSHEQPTSVKWAKDGHHLAVGFNDGSLRIYDPERPMPSNGRLELRTMKVPIQSRCGSLAWKGAVASGGYLSGQIIHHDVRVARHIIGSFNGHHREVVGLHWSPGEKYLASGGCDNTVRLWDSDRVGTGDVSESVYTFDDHIGSVRAVQFCNFKASILATGGGLTDKTIKIWNIHSGELMHNINTESAVNSIVFNRDYKEMMTAHSSGQLHIWQYPSYANTCILKGHQPERAVSLVASPCGQYVMSAGADETLRLWIPFKVDKTTAKLTSQNKLMGMNVR